MCILDFSIGLTHEFHYDSIKIKLGNKSGLLFAGIDSLTYEIKTEDIYDYLVRIKKSLLLVIIKINQNIMMIRTN